MASFAVAAALRLLHSSEGAFGPLAISKCTVSRDCKGPISSAEPEKPTCAPQKRPDCRAKEPQKLVAKRIVCCPPSVGSRPPCTTPRTPDSVTCNSVRSPPATSIRSPCPPREFNCQVADVSRTSSEKLQSCNTDTDRVMQRITAAEKARRADYEAETAARHATRTQSPPPPTYSLRKENECVRTTDGREHSVASAEDPPPAACGPNRTPPKPCCLRLAPDGDCHVRDPKLMDPCAHEPRIVRTIHRENNTAPVTPKPSKKLTSRIMETLKFRNQGIPTCSEGTDDAPGRRKLHTSTANYSNVESLMQRITSEAQSLTAVLSERVDLKSSGCGRVVGTHGCEGGNRRQMNGGGALLLQVPHGTDAVRVDVSLSGTPAQSPDIHSASHLLATTSDKESWLSNLQKKLSGCRPSHKNIGKCLDKLPQKPTEKSGTRAPCSTSTEKQSPAHKTSTDRPLPPRGCDTRPSNK